MNFYAGLYEKESNKTLDMFWSEYTKFNHKNDPFDSNEFIWSSKDICDGKSHLWHQKYSLPPTKDLGVVPCRLNQKILVIGYAEHSWVDIKTINSGKISALGSDIYENQSIVYTSDCID